MRDQQIRLKRNLRPQRLRVLGSVLESPVLLLLRREGGVGGAEDGDGSAFFFFLLGGTGARGEVEGGAVVG